jgi:hypothetical protein
MRKSLYAPPESHRKPWNRRIWYSSSFIFSGFFGTGMFPVGPARRYARKSVMSPIAPSRIRCHISPRASQCRHIRPTPTFMFLATDFSPSSNIFRLVGPSTVTGFSMNTFTPFSTA